MEDAELIHEFVEEALEHLGDVETQLLQIEAMGADINDDLVNTVFRAIHSVKGAAGFLGLTQVNNVAHSLENVLGKVRDHQLVPDPFNVDVMLKAADRLRGLIESIETSNETENSELCEKLDALLVEKAPEPPAPENVPEQLEAIEKALEETIEQPEAESNAKATRTRKKAATKKTTAAKKPRATKKTAAKKTAAKKTAAKKTAVEESREPVEAAEECETPASIVANTPASQPTPAPPTPVAAKKAPAAPAAPAPTAPPTADAAKAPAATPKATPAAESTIRVGVRVLDRLMNLAGELVLSRNQLLRVLGEHDTGSNLDSIVSGLDHVTTELQETIMQTRMQPIGNVFSKFTRVVRDLSGKLGKQCELKIDGKEVEIDKTIIELISDPLTHLVRNSVDHGVEMPAERIAAGKPEAGTLQLRAYHRSGKVRIEIVDDGKGINAAVLKEKAVSKGLLTQEQAEAMGEREAVRLIFHPGFSTAQEVTDVSGRGVGMDVVRSNIEKLGGTVDIETVVGEGTTIVVTLPLTLAIVPSLIIQSGDDRFAIPQVNIAELVRIRNQEEQRVEQVNNKEVLRLRGSLLPLVRLKATLGAVEPKQESSDTDAPGVRHIIVVESGILRYGLVVDDVLDSEEIVVKPLGRHLTDCPCLSGATILGDGRVALILDVNGTAQQAHLRINEEDKSQVIALDQEASDRENKQSVLLFTNDPNEQFAVPMEVVARIERVRSDEIVSVGSQELLHYRNGSLPLLRLENVANAKPSPEQLTYNVIVFETGGHEVGVIAAHLIDIREVPDQFDATTFDDVGVIGSQVIDDRTTRLLDTIELARKSRPDWFDANETKSVSVSSENLSPAIKSTIEQEAESNCVLLAEDSSFFRRQVKRFLEEEGYDVVDCEDGREAWNTLKESPTRFSIVLTDIEMPNMDGLEFTRRIRSENHFADLPIIALTSLASQEDFQRGFDAGVTEYQVKLDRDELIAALKRYTKSAIASSVAVPVGA